MDHHLQINHLLTGALLVLVFELLPDDELFEFPELLLVLVFVFGLRSNVLTGTFELLFELLEELLPSLKTFRRKLPTPVPLFVFDELLLKFLTGTLLLLVLEFIPGFPVLFVLESGPL